MTRKVYSSQGWVETPDERIWAPCLHGPDDKRDVEALLRKVLGDQVVDDYEPLFTEKPYSYKQKLPDGTIKQVDGVSIILNRAITEAVLWELSEIPEVKYSFFSDQWVGIEATNGPRSTWVEADDFTLGIAKTIEIWRADAT